MNFINLHAHSKYSDGHNTLEEHMFAQRKLGMTAVVLTDHIYPEGYDFSLNIEKFKKECEEARQLEDQYEVPFIIGAEVSVMRMEEIVVFGHEALLEILRIKGKGQINLEDLVKIKQDYNCVMNMCHPMHPHNFIKAGCMEFLDGVEYYHSGCPTFDRTFTFPEEFNSICLLSNSDAHHISGLDFGWNETEIPITNEGELIFYEKMRMPFKHHFIDRRMKFLTDIKE